MGNWLIRIEDWSEVHENEMVDRFQPNGVQEGTPPPQVSVQGDRIAIIS